MIIRNTLFTSVLLSALVLNTFVYSDITTVEIPLTDETVNLLIKQAESDLATNDEQKQIDALWSLYKLVLNNQAFDEAKSAAIECINSPSAQVKVRSLCLLGRLAWNDQAFDEAFEAAAKYITGGCDSVV